MYFKDSIILMLTLVLEDLTASKLKINYPMYYGIYT